MRRRPTRSIADCLTNGPAMPVMAHANRVLRAQSAYQRVAPGMLARVSRVANLRDTTVVIFAEHGAAAAKLRALANTLTMGLAREGIECNGIEVRVQPNSMPDADLGGSLKPIGEGGRKALKSLQESLPEGALRNRLQHLLAHAARPASAAEPALQDTRRTDA